MFRVSPYPSLQQRIRGDRVTWAGELGGGKVTSEREQEWATETVSEEESEDP